MTLLSENTMRKRVQAFCHLSKHAFSRLEQRTKLTPEALMRLLDAGAVVNAGKEPCSNREHLLFFSDLDNKCFVAIQDSLSGEVVTLLPLDYHENLAWKITVAQQEAAKRVAERALNGKNDEDFTYFEVKAQYMCPNEQRIKIYTLGKFPRSADLQHVHQTLSSDALRNFINQRVEEKSICWNTLLEIYFREGKSGDPVFFPAAAFRFPHVFNAAS